MNDVITNSKDSIKWENSKLIDFIGYKFSETASLSQILDAMIQNSSTNLTKFKKKIDGIIEDYIEEIKNKIKIQKEGCIENLEKQIKIEEDRNNEFTIRNQKSKEIYESQKKDEIEKKKVWNDLCNDFKKIQKFLENILEEENNGENLEIEHNNRSGFVMDITPAPHF